MAYNRQNQNRSVSLKGLVYLFFVLGLATMVYGLLHQNWLYFFAAALLPAGGIIIYFALNKPILSYILFAIVTCYFSAIYRYAGIENLSVIMDIILGISFLSLALNIINNKSSYPWSNAINTLTVTYAIWLTYCFLILFSPDVSFNNLIANRSVYLSLPLTYLLSAVLMCTPQRLKVTLFLLGIFIATAAFKAYWQKTKGFDSVESAWLFAGAWHTHILRSGIRYFSFYTDAGNFGSSMGMFTVVFGIIAIIVKQKITRIFCLGACILAGVGMMMSGTRGAMIVPFGGLLLYVLLSKSMKAIISCSIFGILTFCFFYFTDIGEGNVFIRRMRTAFRPVEDASFNVRLENQKRFAYYLADKPFGVGIGGRIVDTKGLMELDEDFIPTDSYYVGVWVEGGIVGLCLYITLQALILLRCCYLLMFRIKNDQLRKILAALLCGVFGIWLNGYVGRGMGFQPSSFIIAIFLSFVLNGVYMDKRLKKDEIIA
ncbi:O-antigen ligase family protein [Bacteroides sp.]|uniref:O-antigen ligase family protein n=1 Tax=Bacteroides sp. TaxID=29523 RepID=UPI003AB794C8